MRVRFIGVGCALWPLREGPVGCADGSTTVLAMTARGRRAD